MASKRKVAAKDSEGFVSGKDLLEFQVSAENGVNIKKVFVTLFTLILELNKKDKRKEKHADEASGTIATDDF